MALSDQLPDLGSINFSSVWTVMTWFIIAVFVVIVIGIGIYFYIISTRWKKTIIVFEKVSGKWEITRRDKGMEVYVGTGGETALYLKKHKKYLAYPNTQTGRNTYWYAIGPDNLWRNIGIGDIDEVMDKLKVEYIPIEIGLARASLQKLLKENYQKPKFWEKYGDKIAFGIFILLLGFSLWFAAGRNLEVARILGENIESSTAVIDRAEQILSSLDNICTGSGLR